MAGATNSKIAQQITEIAESTDSITGQKIINKLAINYVICANCIE